MRKHISKRNKMDAGKLGVIFLVAIVALAGAGVAYSMWSQQLTITGVVQSGEVKIGLYNFRTLDSGPSVSEGGILYPTGSDPVNEGTADPYKSPESDNLDGKNIASHNSLNDGIVMFEKTIGVDKYTFTDHVTEELWGVYPWYASGTEVYVGNGGTIPVKITDIVYTNAVGNEHILDFIEIEGWDVDEYSATGGWSDVASGTTIQQLIDALNCFQLDPCHTLSIEMNFYFVEEISVSDDTDDADDAGVLLPEGESLTFDIVMTAVQWNEAPCDVPPPQFCVPTLTLDKTVRYLSKDEQPHVGSNIEYTVMVTNTGITCDATNVVVNDELPDDLTYVDHSVSPGSKADYNELTGVWTIGTLPHDTSATLTITATIEGSGGTAITPTQLALVIDGSGSIDPPEWSLMVNGLADAIEDPTVFPQDGSIELSVIQFGGSTARVEVDTVIISNPTVASSVATTIRGIQKNLGSLTPLGAGLAKTSETLKASPDYSSFPRKVINVVTDGVPTSGLPDPQTAAINARNDLLLNLEMVDADDGEIDSEAIGDETDIPWLQTNIVWPGSYLWVPPTLPLGPGWVRYVSDFAGFEEAIKEKFAITILSEIENCATLDADHFKQVEDCIAFTPLPAQTPPAP